MRASVTGKQTSVKDVLDLFSPFPVIASASVRVYVYVVSKGSREHIELCVRIYILIHTFARVEIGGCCV